MKHHFARNDTLAHCLYCNADLRYLNWSSHFEMDHHYKSIRCKCGKHNRVKVDFLGSGHDDWRAGEMKLSFEELVTLEKSKLK